MQHQENALTQSMDDNKSVAEDDYQKLTKYHLIQLIKENKIDILRIERIFKSFPELVYTKDEQGISLYQNVVRKYIDSIKELNEENILYYSNLLSSITFLKKFYLAADIRKACLNDILGAINDINVMKLNRNERKKRLKYVKSLQEMVASKNGEKEDVEIIASKYGIDLAIPKSLYKYHLDTFIVEGRQRNDDYTITIDKNASIIDSALSCKKLLNGNYLYGIHVADPLGYYDYYHPVVQEAMNRESNIYLPIKFENENNNLTKTIPIFDYRFSAGIASLKQGMRKYTRSHYFEINKTDGIVSEKHIKTITRVNHNKTYAEVEKLLKKGTKDKELCTLLNDLSEVTKILEAFYRPQQLYIDANTHKDEHVNAHKIVDIAQILVGNKVADNFAEKGYPCLYRVLEINEFDEKLSRVIHALQKEYYKNGENQLYEILRELYTKGKYGMKGAHEGLNLEHYCRVHSPLRKAPDLLMEHAQEVCFDKKPSDLEIYKLEEEIKTRQELINQKEDRISLFRAEVKRKLVKRKK